MTIGQLDAVVKLNFSGGLRRVSGGQDAGLAATTGSFQNADGEYAAHQLDPLGRNVGFPDKLWPHVSCATVGRMYQRVLFLVLVGLSAYATQRASSGPAPGSTKLGDYIVEPYRPSEACGVDVKHGFVGQLTQRIFYKERLVTAVSMFAFVSPWNPSRLLYSVASSCGEDEKQAGTFYFDGNRDAPVQAGVSGTVAPPQTLSALWSPDDKFVAIPSNGIDFSLLNLQTAQNTNLSKLFYNHESVISSVEFREWSADGKKLALVVSSLFRRTSGRMAYESELLSVGPASLQPTYVATMCRENGWQKGEFVWVSKDGGFELAVHPGLRNSTAIFVKKPPSSAASKTSK